MKMHSHADEQSRNDGNGDANEWLAGDLAFLERIVRFQDGGLSSEEQAVFEEELAGDPAKRRLFGDQFVQSMLVYDRLRHEAYRTPSSIRLPAWRARLGSRVAVVALGVLLGMCSVSIVLAYAAPIRSVAVTVMRESFDGDVQLHSAGMPSEPGVWSGDYADIVGVSDGVQPAHGRHMLRFLRGDHEGRFIPESHASDVFRIVDLRHLRRDLSDGTAVVHLGALFNAAGSAADPLFCTLTIYALDTALVHGGGPLADADVSRNSLAHSQSSRVRLDADPATWQRATNELRLPPETDYVMIRTGISNDSQVPGRRTDEFGAHYVDDVKLVIGHRPELVLP